jgi:hypothetical protein
MTNLQLGSLCPSSYTPRLCSKKDGLGIFAKDNSFEISTVSCMFNEQKYMRRTPKPKQVKNLRESPFNLAHDMTPRDPLTLV